MSAAAQIIRDEFQYWPGLKYSQLNLHNEPNPGLFSSFPKQLKALSEEFNIPMRVTWMPDRWVRGMIGLNGNSNGVRVPIYPTNPPTKDKKHKGWNVTRVAEDGTKRHVAHYAIHRLPTKFQGNAYADHYDDKTGLWWETVWEVEEVCLSRWQVEYRAPDSQEKNDYEGMTYLPKSNQLIRELGAFPAEGAWFPMGPYIADHNALCCSEANDVMCPCPGTYRPPSQIDIEVLRQAIYHRNKDGRWQGPDQANTEAFQAIIKQRLEEEEIARLGRIAHFTEIAQEAINPVILGMTPKSIGGVNKPRHTVPYSQDNLDSISEMMEK